MRTRPSASDKASRVSIVMSMFVALAPSDVFCSCVSVDQRLDKRFKFPLSHLFGDKGYCPPLLGTRSHREVSN